MTGQRYNSRRNPGSHQTLLAHMVRKRTVGRLALACTRANCDKTAGAR